MLIDQRSRQTVTAEPGAVAFPEKYELEVFPDTNFHGMCAHFRHDVTQITSVQKWSRGPAVHVVEEQTNRTAWSPKLGFLRKSGLNNIYCPKVVE